MNEDLLIKGFMQAALVTIMFGMGLSLSLAEFKRLVNHPGQIILGSFGQLLVLPLFAALVCYVMNPSLYIVMGVMIVVCCPGGPISNYFTYASNGNAELSVTITTATTLLSIITLPVIFSLDPVVTYFNIVTIPRDFIIKSLLVGLLLPIVLGMIFNALFSNLAQVIKLPLNKFGMFLILIVLLLISYKNKDLVSVTGLNLLVTIVAINVGAMVIGYYMAKFSAWRYADRISLSYELGLQNVPLATLIGYSLMEQSSMSGHIDTILASIGIYAIVSVFFSFVGVYVFTNIISKKTEALVY